MNRNQRWAPLHGLRALAARRPIALFLALAFGLVYPGMALVVLAARGIIPGADLPARLGLDMERAASLMLTFLGLLPAALIVTWLEGGQPALRALVRRISLWRFGLVWWLIAVAALPASTVVIALLLGDSIRVPSLAVLADEAVSAAVALLLINLWEETAWSGFLQTRLERRHSFGVAAVLTAIPFAAMHLPLKLVNGGAFSELPQAFVLYLILGLLVRPLFGMVRRGAGDSVLAAGLAHTFFNRSNNNDGIAADLLIGSNRQLGALIATVLLTIVVGLVIRRRLSRAYGYETDTTQGTEPGTSVAR